MSVASEISRIQGLRNRIRTKLINIGIMTPEYLASGGGGIRDTTPTNDLFDCTEAIEDIDELNPIMLSTTNVTNVAAYKYAQVDATAFQPSGPLPSDLCSKVAYLGANGIESTSPTNYASLGDVTPPQGYNGMRVVTLKIDTDVIKAENIRSGVSILGVNGTLSFGLSYGQKYAGSASSGSNTLTVSNVPFSSIYQLAYVAVSLYDINSQSNTKLVSIVAFTVGSGLGFVAHMNNDNVPVNYGFSFSVSNGNLVITSTYLQNNPFYGQYYVRYGYNPDGNIWSD